MALIRPANGIEFGLDTSVGRWRRIDHIDSLVGPYTISIFDLRDKTEGQKVRALCDHDIDVYCPPVGEFAELNERYKQQLKEAKSRHNAAYDEVYGDDLDDYFDAFAEAELNALDDLLETLPTTRAGIDARPNSGSSRPATQCDTAHRHTVSAP